MFPQRSLALLIFLQKIKSLVTFEAILFLPFPKFSFIIPDPRRSLRSQNDRKQFHSFPETMTHYFTNIHDAPQNPHRRAASITSNEDPSSLHSFLCESRRSEYREECRAVARLQPTLRSKVADQKTNEKSLAAERNPPRCRGARKVLTPPEGKGGRASLSSKIIRSCVSEKWLSRRPIFRP